LDPELAVHKYLELAEMNGANILENTEFIDYEEKADCVEVRVLKDN